MRYLMAALAFVSSAALSQTVCDVVYSSDITMFDAAGVEHNVMGPIPVPVYSVPFTDVLDNHQKGLKVIDAVSKAQNKGGPYRIVMSETRACDSGPPASVTDGGADAKGITAKDLNAIMRLGLQLQGQVVGRFEGRVVKGAKTGWDHGKAKNTQRDDLGNHK